MKKKYFPIKAIIVLMIIFILGFLFAIISFNDLSLFEKIMIVICDIIILIGIVLLLFTYIEFDDEKVYLKLKTYSNYNELKAKILKGPKIFYKDINRIDYDDYKSKNGSMNIVKIELKDNNKTVAININGFTKFQRAKIKKQLNDIFVVKNDNWFYYKSLFRILFKVQSV